MGQFPEYPPESKFKALPARLFTALGMAGVALGAYLGGPLTFSLLCLALFGILLFELSGLQSPEFSRVKRAAFVLFGCVVLAIALYHFLKAEPLSPLQPMLIALLFGGFGIFLKFRMAMVFCGVGVYLAVLGFISTYLADNLIFILVALLIVGTDVGGYFVGKVVGGPKIAPRISPNKTWSGTIGGWVLALMILFVFAYFWTNELPSMAIILLTVAISIFAQLGDLAISLLKRKVGVKDSSSLLPGHGGFLDRFDGFIGAGVLIFLLSMIYDIATLG